MASARTQITQGPGFAVEKVVDPVVAATPRTLNYTITIANTGNVALDLPLNGITDRVTTPSGTVARPLTLASGDTGGDQKLGVGEIWTLTASYDLTQAAIDAGDPANPGTTGFDIVNTARVPAMFKGSALIQSDIATTTVTRGPALAVSKSVNRASIAAPGDLTYTITVENTGNIALTGVVLTDRISQGATQSPPTSGPTLAAGDSDGDGVLDVGERWTYGASFAVNQAAIDAGGTLQNTVTVSTGQTAPTSASAATTIQSQPALSVDKTVDRATVTQAGPLTYTIEVRNTGNVTLRNLVLHDSLVPTGDITPNPAGMSLAIGQTRRFTAVYNVTQADLDAGGLIVNSVTASADGLPPDAAQDSVSSQIEQVSRLSMSKTVDRTSLDGPGLLTYGITVTNTGNTSISGCSLADRVTQDSSNGGSTQIAITQPVCGPAQSVLAPGASWTWTASLNVTQAIFDRGTAITNTASFSATNIGPVSAQAVTVLGRNPDFSIDRSVSSDTLSAPGTLSHTITVRNTGNATLTNPTLSDPGLPGLTGPAGDANGDRQLDVGEVWVWTATQTTTQAMIDAGDPIRNLATLGTNETLSKSDETIVRILRSPAARLTKTVSPAAVSAPQTVAYTIRAENTGNVTLTAPILSDSLIPTAAPAAGDNGNAKLDVGEIWVWNLPYDVTQEMIDSGNPILNTARLRADQISPLSATASVAIQQGPGLALIKAGSLQDANGNSRADAGERIRYDFTLRNTGNVALLQVGVTDPALTPQLVGSVARLAPAATATLSASYVLTQADIDRGSVTNSALARGQTTGGTVAEDRSGTGAGNDSPTVVALPARPGLSLDKRLAAGEEPTFTRLGRIINYEFEVTNTGNVTLSGPVSVSDSLTTTPVCPAGNLLPGASMTCVSNLRVAQADLDRGRIDNTATANAGGQAASDSLVMLAIQNPALGLEKSSDHSGAFAAGVEVLYSYRVTNRGNQTVRGPITISDSKIAGGIECLPAGQVLLPGDARVCTASYTVTAADSGAGSVTNNATATGQGPQGPVQSAVASVTVPGDVAPALSLRKQFLVGGTVTDSLTYATAGEVITYRFTLTNTGTTDIFGALRVEDETLGQSVECRPTRGPTTPTLAYSSTPPDDPDSTAICDLTYTVTQADIDRRQIRNTAYARASVPDGSGGLADITSPHASATAVAASAPSLRLTKTAVPPSGGVPGDVIVFTVTALNDGNQTLRDLRVLDPMLADFSCPATAVVMLPGDSMDCTGTWKVTQADVDAGRIENTATATAFSPPPPAGGNGVALSAEARAVHQTQAAASDLGLTKLADLVDADRNGFATLGDTIKYTLTITNNGNVTLRGVSIDDPMLSATPLLKLAELLPGERRTLVANYPLTQADLDAPSGVKENTATASGRDPANGAVSAPPATVSLPLRTQSGIELLKTGSFVDVNGNGRANAGDRMDYAFAIRNTGTVTLTNVTLTDALPGVSIAGSPIASLPPGAVDHSVTGTYQLVQADVDRGRLSNTASVRAEAPGGGTVADAHSVDTNLAAVGVLRLVKRGEYIDADGNGRVNLGDRIEYRLEVTNTGTVTLQPVVVTDPLLALNQTIAQMGPGTSQVLTRTYAVTQTDIDQGARDNLARVVGTRPNGTAAEHQAFARVPLAQLADFTLTKDAAYQDRNADGRISVGDQIVYRMVVRNTGSVTLNGVEISDALLGGVVAQTNALEPGQDESVLGEYALTQADIDAGSVTNDAVAQARGPQGTLLTRRAQVTTPLDATPSMRVTKIADQQVIGQSGVIGYTIRLENTGTATLTGISIEDRLRQDGRFVAALQPTPMDRGDGNATLSPGEVWTWRASHVADQQQIDAGGDLVNRVRIGAANTPLTVIAQATTRIEAQTGLDLVKTATAALSDPPRPGDVVTYRFRITNTGQQRLTGISLSDPMQGLTLQHPTAPGLNAGASVEMTGTYALTQADLDRGLVSNQATVAGTRADGTVLRDLSGPQPATDAPTILPLDPEAELVLVKSARHDDANGDGAMNPGEALVYGFTVQNLGNVVLRNITVSDPTLPGGPFGTVAVLQPGEVRQIPESGSHALTARDLVAGQITNTATATGSRPDGAPVTGRDTLVTPLTAAAPQAVDDDMLLQRPGVPVILDVLANDRAGGSVPLDPSSIRIAGAPGDGRRLAVDGQGVWTVDPAAATLTFTPQAGLASDPDPVRYRVGTLNGVMSGAATVTVTFARIGLALENRISDNRDLNGNGITDAGDLAAFEFTVTNTGNVPLTGVTVAATSLPMPGLVCDPVDLAAGAGAVLHCTGAGYVITDQDMQAGEIAMSATAHATDPWGLPVSARDMIEQPVTQPVEPTLRLTKHALLTRIRAGQDVPFEITVENLEAEQRAIVNVVDSLPPGFLFRQGSGRVDGQQVEPRDSGARVTFGRIGIDPGKTVVIRLTAFVPGSVTPGDYVNRVVALDRETGRQLGNQATATVTIEAEPVFDCGTVIGRVFDDLSGDGYQQPGEPGLGGVRLVTVNGVFVTSDGHGRFHLPCPDLPRDIGSNFVLKLDDSSLPAEYAVTSENPRVIRLTAGKMTEVNFGAARLQLVAVDLAAMAFAGSEPIPALAEGLKGMVAQIATRPSLIRLNYTQTQESRDLAVGRLQAVARMIRDIWPAHAISAPRIETRITRQKAPE